MSDCFLQTSLTEAYFVLKFINTFALQIYNQKFKFLQTWSNETNDKFNCEKLEFVKSIVTSQNNVTKIWNDKTRKHSFILIFIENDQNESRFNCDLIDQYEKYYQSSCFQNQSKILDFTCLSTNVKIEALLVQENNNQYIYRWISESASFCLASQQIQSDKGEIYIRVIILNYFIVICFEFVENFVALQIWRRNRNCRKPVSMNWTRFSQKGKVIKLTSLDMRSFCLAIDTELRIFDAKCSIISIIAIDRDYILEDIVYDFGFERLIVVCSKDDFVRQLIFTDDWTESDLKVEIKGLRQVILDSSGRWCSFNHESVLQVFAKDNQLAEVKLEDDGQLCSFAKDGEVIVAVAKADGNILGYFPLGPNNEKDTTQLDPMWQVGCGQSDDETRWKVHNSENRVFVQREDTFSICEKYGDKERILCGYNRCALANWAKDRRAESISQVYRDIHIHVSQYLSTSTIIARIRCLLSVASTQLPIRNSQQALA